MQKLPRLLLFVVLSASCGDRRGAPPPPASSASVNPSPAQGSNTHGAQSPSSPVNCDFSSYNPLVRPINAGPMISRPQPSYPSEAKEKRVGGLVRVRILINAGSGHVEQACVVEGDELLANAAKGAALRARFSPYMGGSKYIKENYRFIESVITYNFVLQ